jgi:all-trans-retinol dehydrogenase (NAD+)
MGASAMEVITFILQAIFVVTKENILFLIKLFIPSREKSVDGQLALITGGSRGLGKALAMRLAKKKCNIAICDINYAQAQETCREIEAKFGVLAQAFKTNVSNPDDVRNLRNAIEIKMGSVDILVNNAGILSPLAYFEGTDDDIRNVIDVNLMAHFWV